MVLGAKLKSAGLRGALAIAVAGTACLHSVEASAQIKVGKSFESYLNDVSGTEEHFSCNASESRKKVFGGVVKEKKLRRKLVEEAVGKAISEGYNYAMIRPTAKVPYRRASAEYIRYGFGRAYPEVAVGAERFGFVVQCSGIDDIAAFDLAWYDDFGSMAPSDAIVVDLRKFSRALDLDVPTPPQEGRRIDRVRLVGFGGQEVVDEQYEVKRKAFECRTGWTPVSIDQFKSEGSRDRDAERQCLLKLKDEAAAAGWDAFPLASESDVASIAERGYALNTAAITSAATEVGTFDGILSRKDYHDVTADFPGFEGLVLQGRHKDSSIGGSGRTLLVVSDTMSDDIMMDVAMFQTARYMMTKESSHLLSLSSNSSSDPGLAVRDMRTWYEEAVVGDDWLHPEQIRSVQRALRRYGKAKVFGQQNVASSKQCEDSHLVCADKLAVYNTLGPKLNVVGFQPLKTPLDYKPYK